MPSATDTARTAQSPTFLPVGFSLYCVQIIITFALDSVDIVFKLVDLMSSLEVVADAHSRHSRDAALDETSNKVAH